MRGVKKPQMQRRRDGRSNKTQEAHNMSSAFKLWSLLNIIYIIILPHRVYVQGTLYTKAYM